MSVDFSVGGRRVLVTGAAGDLGLAVVDAFVEAGAHVVGTDLAPERPVIGSSAYVSADLTAAGASEHVVGVCAQTLGGIDVLVNVAGVYPLVPAVELTLADWQRLCAVNVRGTVMTSAAAGRLMAAQRTGGRIVNISSICAFQPWKVGSAAYDASKAAVQAFTRNFALEMAPHGVTVNAVAPGGFAAAGGGDLEARRKAEARIPLGRLAEPGEIAAAVIFLAGPAAGYVTGATLVVDAGRLLT